MSASQPWSTASVARGGWTRLNWGGGSRVGKLDATADTDAPRVTAIHQDVAFTKAVTAAVTRESRDLARWLDRDLVLPAADRG